MSSAFFFLIKRGKLQVGALLALAQKSQTGKCLEIVERINTEISGRYLMRNCGSWKTSKFAAA